MTETLCEKSFAVDSFYSNFYAGGDLAWSSNGERLFCYNTKVITCIKVATGQVERVFSLNENNFINEADIDFEEDIIYTFDLSDDNENLLTAHRSGLLRLWSVDTGKTLKLWKSQHKGPVVKVQFSPCCKIVCSSGADSTFRLWDLIQHQCVAVLREYSGPSRVMSFHPSLTRAEITAVGADNVIYYWNYESKKLLHQLRGHLSCVTALSFDFKSDKNGACDHLVTVSRDKVLIIWDVSDGRQLKVIPLYEELEGVICLPTNRENDADFLVASARGTLSLVHSRSAKITPLIDIIHCGIKQILHCKQIDAFAVITVEQNILLYKLQSFNKLQCIKQIIGFNDEVLDLCLLGHNDRFLTVATNSKNIKVYDTAADMNCKLFAGHKDTVITLSAAGMNSNMLLSSGKDFSILLWKLMITDQSNGVNNDFELVCMGKNISSHTSTIGSLSFGVNNDEIFASVSQDGSMKMWQLKYHKKSNEYSFALRYAVIAHNKEVNCVTFSPNNKLLATASQDKTVKLWSSEAQAIIGTLRGHLRGVWCVRFSPVDQIILTSSADCSLRIWSLSTLTCLKRFEEGCSVLRAEFIVNSKYIIAAGSDGLLKTWNIKTGTCMQTLDNHTDRIWSLAVSQYTHKYFYSGGADSKIVRWRDSSKELSNVQIDQQQKYIEQDQSLQLLLHNKKNLEKALVISLQLSKPKTTYDILKLFIRQRNQTGLKSAIYNLNDEQCCVLLDNVKIWNSNSRFTQVANLVLQHLLRQLLDNPTKQLKNKQKIIEVLKPYEKRHFKRLTEMQKDIAFLDFVVKCM